MTSPTPFTCSGVVVDDRGMPVAGAEVVAMRFFWGDERLGTHYVQIGQAVTTGNDGRFKFATRAPLSESPSLVVFARKAGLTLGWSRWPYTKADSEVAVKLSPGSDPQGRPNALRGAVVDEDGKPIAGASVAAFLRKDSRDVIGLPALKWLDTRTDPNGRFELAAVPPEAQAEFLVSAPGRALLFTGSNPKPYGFGQYSTSTDARIVLPKAGRIEARVVDKLTGKGVAGLSFKAVMGGSMWGLENARAVSGPDGELGFSGLRPGTWSLREVCGPTDRPAWVCTSAYAEVEAGKMTRDVKVEATTGAMLDLSLVDPNGLPVPNALFIVSNAKMNWARRCQTDPNGHARVRVMPGLVKAEWAMAMDAHTYMLAAKETITIAPGQTRTVRMQARLEPIPGGPATQPAPAGDSERAEEIDFIKLRATLCEAYARSEKDQRNLHIVALVQQYEPGEAAGQWVKSPAYTRTWSWYERRRGAKARIDYDPQKLKWVGGTAPYSETRFMLAFDGSGFRKIDFVYGYGEAPHYWPSVTEDYDTNNPKRLANAARDTGIAFLPEPPSSFPSRELAILESGFAERMDELLQPWTEELARKGGIRASKVTSNGLTLIRVTLPRGNDIQTFFLDPQKGYSLVRAERSSGGNLTSLYRAEQWKQLTPNLWFPVKWTARGMHAPNQWRLDYEASEAGFYDPAQGPDIFGAKDVKLGVRIDRPPHGPASAPPPATQPTSQPADTLGIAWQAESDGIEFGLKLDGANTSYRIGQEVGFVICARNTGPAIREVEILNVAEGAWIPRIGKGRIDLCAGLLVSGRRDVLQIPIRPGQTRMVRVVRFLLVPPDFTGDTRGLATLRVTPSEYRVYYTPEIERVGPLGMSPEVFVSHPAAVKPDATDLALEVTAASDEQLKELRAKYPQPAAEVPWGEAVEGVQVRVRAGKVQWKAGETPTLVADARNLGTLKLRGSPYLFSYSVQIDGQWFQRTIITASSGSLDFGPGKQFLDTGIRLIGLELTDPTTHKALELKPGKHTVRVAFAADGEKKGVRAVSNAVEIEIQPADPKPGTQPAGSRLEFRIAPSASSLTNAERNSYMDGLKAGRVGPWWETGEKQWQGQIPVYMWLAFAGDMANVGNMVMGEYKGQKYVLVSDKPGQTMVTGEGKEAWGLAKAYATTDAMNLPAVGFEMDDRGAELFAAFTKANIGNVVAIVVDGKVISVPVIRAAIGKQGTIPGQFSEQEVQALVQALKAGMPPAHAGPATHPASGSGGQVLEGVGHKGLIVGMSVQEVLDMFGPPDKRQDSDKTHAGLQYRQSRGIDILFIDGKAREIRFDKGFAATLSRGAGIGTPMETVLKTYGQPIMTVVTVEEKFADYGDRVLCKSDSLLGLGASSKIEYTTKGVLFRFDTEGKVKQFVVFAPYGEPATQPAPGGAATQPAGSEDEKAVADLAGRFVKAVMSEDRQAALSLTASMPGAGITQPAEPSPEKTLQRMWDKAPEIRKLYQGHADLLWAPQNCGVLGNMAFATYPTPASIEDVLAAAMMRQGKEWKVVDLAVTKVKDVRLSQWVQVGSATYGAMSGMAAYVGTMHISSDGPTTLPALGSPIERIVAYTQGFPSQAVPGSGAMFLDVDTGSYLKFGRLPDSGTIRKSGVDICYERPAGEEAGPRLATSGMQMQPLSKETGWQSDLKTVRHALMVASPYALTASETAPVAFSTGDGGIGILQIVNVMDSPSRVTIRYKLLQAGPAAATQPATLSWGKGPLRIQDGDSVIEGKRIAIEDGHMQVEGNAIIKVNNGAEVKGDRIDIRPNVPATQPAKNGQSFPTTEHGRDLFRKVLADIGKVDFLVEHWNEKGTNVGGPRRSLVLRGTESPRPKEWLSVAISEAQASQIVTKLAKLGVFDRLTDHTYDVGSPIPEWGPPQPKRVPGYLLHVLISGKVTSGEAFVDLSGGGDEAVARIVLALRADLTGQAADAADVILGELGKEMPATQPAPIGPATQPGG